MTKIRCDVSDEPINVIVDDREKNSDLLGNLQDNPALHVTIRRLPLGDYQFANKVIFERKTIMDFAKSIIDGRLFSQMCRLASSSIRGVLLIEGTLTELSAINMRREAMQGALIMVNVILGIPVLRAQNATEGAQLMLYTANQITSNSNLTISRKVKRPKGKRKAQLYVLQSLPGIGPARAKKLLDKFGNVEAVVNASSADLQSVSGIGEDIANRMRWVIKESVSSYIILDSAVRISYNSKMLRI